MINYIDLILIAIVILFVVIGCKKGFAMSILGFSSTIISLIVSVLLYNPLTEFLKKTVIFTWTEQSVYNQLCPSGVKTMPDDTLSNVIKDTQLPDFLKDSLVKNSENINVKQSVEGIYQSISNYVAGILICIFSILLLFIVTKILLYILKKVMKHVTKIPVIHSVDKIGGFLIGLVQGVIIAYLVLMAVTVIASFNDIPWISSYLDSSIFTKFIQK